MQSDFHEKHCMQTYNLWHLLKNPHFLPLLGTHFFAVLNDHYLKITFMFWLFYIQLTPKAPLLLFFVIIYTLPYIFLSSFAGQFADRFDKAHLARLLQFTNIFTSLFAAFALILSSTSLMLISIMLFACGNALFIPIKYGILPDELPLKQLPHANAWMVIANFFALIIAFILAYLSFYFLNGLQFISALCIIIFACTAWGVSHFFVKNHTSKKEIKIDYNIYKTIIWQISSLIKTKRLWGVSLMLSWFYGLIVLLLSVFIPVGFMDGNIFSFIMFIVVFAIAMIIGLSVAAFANALRIIVLPTVLSCFLCAILLIFMGFFIDNLHQTVKIQNFHQFFDHRFYKHIAIILALIAFFSAFIVVSSLSLLEAFAKDTQKAQFISANIIFNAVFIMIISAIFAICFIYFVSAKFMLIGFGVYSLLCAGLLLKYLPTNPLLDIASLLFRMFFRLQYKGMDNFTKVGKNPILSIDHVSLCDCLLALLICECANLKSPVFAIHTDIAKRWYIRPFLKFFNAFPIDSTKPLTTRALIRASKKGVPLVLFLNSDIIVTTRLMKNYDSAALLMEQIEASAKSNVKILPIKMQGLERSYFAYKNPMLMRRYFIPKVKVTIAEPIDINKPTQLTNKARRHNLGNELYNIMDDLAFKTSLPTGTLFEFLKNAAKDYGLKKTILEDMLSDNMFSGSLTYGQILFYTRLIAQKLLPPLKEEEKIALLLPNANSTVLAFFALQSLEKIPAMLNFTVGLAMLKSAMLAANIKTIITSQKFIKNVKLEENVKALKAQNIRFIYIENLEKSFTMFNKIAAWLQCEEPIDKNKTANDIATILFTSGSEGNPKGVALCHKNILTNIAQISARIDFNEKDKIFNILPMFHSFGLTVATLLPLTKGVPVCLYPSPLHYKEVPEAIFAVRATMIFTTDTFLNGYGRNAQTFDLSSLRYCLAGAEPVKSSTRELLIQKYGIRILEGYGVTEASPVLSLNTQNYTKLGSVGKLLPGIKTRLEKMEGIEKGGRLFVKGDNIMAGYLTVEQPNILIKPMDAWHDTGDIVEIDEDNFITILGRAKRFAKIGSEMVSLTAMEKLASKIWPEIILAIIAVKDEKKGERLVFVSDDSRPNRQEFLQFAKKNGVAEINVPTKFIKATIPILGTGKVDYRGLKKIAEEKINSL